MSEIIEIFDNTTVHSLNLRQQQQVEEELQIIKKKIKKGNHLMNLKITIHYI